MTDTRLPLRGLTLRGLYAITPDLPDTAALLGTVEQLLRGGTRLLQYRRKATPTGHRQREARQVTELCHRLGARLIVNDDPQLAAEVGADGVHVGRDDGDIGSARRLLGPDAIIGVSCYGSLERAAAAAEAGADYVAFGSMFASSSKPQAPLAPIALLQQARPCGLPVCAIGGITLERAPALVAAGADLLAVIGDLFDAPDPAAQAMAYGRLFDAGAAADRLPR